MSIYSIRNVHYEELSLCAEVIRRSVLTVVNEFELTVENSRPVRNGIAGARPFPSGRNPPEGGVPLRRTHGTLYREAESVRVGHILQVSI